MQKKYLVQKQNGGREGEREREDRRGVVHHVFCNSRNKFAFVKKKKENKEIG